MKTKSLRGAFLGVLAGSTCILLAPSGWAALSTNAQALAAANTGFSFNLLTEIVKEQPDNNVFISPYSVATVLQMVENGAGGQTQRELRQVLGLNQLTRAAQNEAHRELHHLIEAHTANLVLNTANALWYRQGFVLKPEFIACNQTYYDATVKGLNFDQASAADQINAWVNEKTHGKINQMVSPPIDPLTRLYLANAVYFNGQWISRFKVEDTKDKVFHLRKDREKKLPMMVQSGIFSYRRVNGYQAVRLPYEGENLGMYVFLPNANSSPAKLLARMNRENWQTVELPLCPLEKGTLMLPRFIFEYGIDLKRPLGALRIKRAFAENADFSALSHDPFYVSQATQKTFVEVNEKGTAAASMFYSGGPSAGRMPAPPEPFEMIVDRPFVVIIEDYASSTVLFMGIINDPAPGS